MTLTKNLFTSVCPAAIMVVPLALSITPAFAQSTGTQEVETVVVTGSKLATSFTGLMAGEPVLKQRSAVSADFIETQPAGQTFFQDLNYLPGVNFTNTDPYGASGGDLRLHGMDGNHISLTLDGMPLNDTGNYAIYTNQMLDPELIGKVSVNQGTTDVDSPTASAVGGTINVLTAPAADEFHVMGKVSYASYDFRRFFVRADSGEIGPWHTKAFMTLSYQQYNKFKGPGYERRIQGNVGVEQDLGPLGFIKVYAHYNSNRNNFYNNISYYPVLPTSAAGYSIGTPNTIQGSGGYVSPVTPATNDDNVSAGNNLQGYGLGYDEANACEWNSALASAGAANPLIPVAGTAQNQGGTQGIGGSATSTTAMCTNFYRLRINPSETGNIRAFSLFHLTQSLTLTVDPSFQYVLANGGGVTNVSETDRRLIGNTTGSGTTTTPFGCIAGVGCDLNGDGDVKDLIMLYTPNTTNTRRWDVNASLIYTLNDENTFQAAYTLDYGLHRQTGQWARFDANNGPYNVWAGKVDRAHAAVTADGADLRGRDRKSYALLNQVSFDYEGRYWDDSVRVSAGFRLPWLHRGMNQYCYLQATGNFTVNTPGVGFQYCTTETPSAVAANGTVTFAGITSSTATFTPPGKRNVTYNKFLPNLGVSWNPFGKEHQFYASYAQTLSAPRTDNLYNGGFAAGIYSTYDASVKPEAASEMTLGYRFTGETLHASLTAWNMQFKDRIVSTYDPDQGISVDHNIGPVNLAGVDFETDWNPIDTLDVYGSVSYEHSRVINNLPLGIASSSTKMDGVAATVGSPYYAHTGGKEFVETPDWTLASRASYEIWNFRIGAGVKYVSRRFASEDNGYRVPDYYTVNADVTYYLDKLGLENSSLRFNVDNLFNNHYFSSVGTSRSCFTPLTANVTTGCTSYPFLSVGAPRTLQITLKATF